MSLIMDACYKRYSQYRQDVEKWLAYPRYLQQEYGINPVIAGGAIRDVMLGAEVNDIDLFISASDWRLFFNLLEVSDVSSVDRAEIWGDYTYNVADREGWKYDRAGREGDHTQIVGIYNHKDSLVKQEYNIAILPKGISANGVIKDFNFGINHVAMNTYGILSISSNFIHDVEGQVITQRNTQSQATIDDAYGRICKKYPWPLHSQAGIELIPATPHIMGVV